MAFVIEHMDGPLYEWSFIEYKHAASAIGREELWVTNLSRRGVERISPFASAYTKKARQLLDINSLCVLDIDAEETLTPARASRFTHFVFGGIMGDNPRKHRTSSLIPGAKRFNLGKSQFTTDTAVMVAYLIKKGVKLGEMHFAYELEVNVEEGLSLTLPYHFLVIKGKPFVSPELIRHIINSHSF